MDSLPKSLLYMTTQISNFTRNVVRVNSLNQDSLSSNGVQQIRVAMPVNAVLNLKSLSMHAKCTTVGAVGTDSTEANHALIPKGGIAALLDRVTWAAGGLALDNGPVPYHVIHAVKENLEKGSQKYLSDDRVLAQAEIEDRTKHANPAAASYGQQKDLIQNNFLGFTQSHPSYLDFSLLPECFCTIQCAPSHVLPGQPSTGQLGDALVAGGRNFSYSLTDIYFTVEVCQIGSGMYDALTQRLLQERGSIDIPYPQYQTFSTTTGPNQGVDGGIRGSVSCMSLDRMYVVARDRAYTNVAPPVRCENSIGSAFQQLAINFSSQDTDSWQFQLNNAPMPMYRADTLDAFNYAVCAEDRTYSHDRGCLVSSQEEWQQNKWCSTMRLCLDNEPTRLSGVNLSSINAQVVWDVTTDGSAGPTAGCQIMLITKQTSVLRVGQSRACAVVA